MAASPGKRRLPNYEVAGKNILSGVSKSFKLPRVMFGGGYPLLPLRSRTAIDDRDARESQSRIGVRSDPTPSAFLRGVFS
jgi:hypothetical protein